MNPHRLKKPASDEYTTDEEEMIVYDVQDEIETNPDYVKKMPKLALAPITPTFTHSLTHKILKLEMTEEKLIDHIISRLEPQILDYVEVRHPQTTSDLLQIIDKNEERFLKRRFRGSSWESRDIKPNENNRFPNRNRQENWRETRGNNRYADNTRPQREFNRFDSQGVVDNQRFDGRRRGGQSDQRFHNQGDRQGGSRNSSFRGQSDRNRYLNF
ncbi:uncharacterized protein TNCV_3769031 [Trichonephila clavipes]|nr:uncharacterized protein TNCV_3769031 [Trichonephila clavipes]